MYNLKQRGRILKHINMLDLSMLYCVNAMNLGLSFKIKEYDIYSIGSCPMY